MKTLVINLDKRPDRLSFITNELQGHGIEFERVAAVDGDLVDLNKLKESGFGLYNDWIDPMLFRGLTSGEIGCALSHIQCWNIATQLEEPVLILEDDVQVTEAPDFKEWETLSLAYDIIYLDHKEMLPEHTLTLNNRFQSICYPYWMSAYIIHHEFAKKLLTSGYLNNIIPVDELIPVLNSNRTISQDERVTKVFSDLRDKIRIDSGIKC
ncbi:MAG: glycosyltransferase family 25 protein, partial [Proteobacteria bacterium]|nr:glycosyltransferase family 25 protein [Pseudomonadota bacterium]